MIIALNHFEVVMDKKARKRRLSDQKEKEKEERSLPKHDNSSD